MKFSAVARLRRRVFHGAGHRRVPLAPEAAGAVGNPCSCRRTVTGLVPAVVREQRPDDAGILVGERHGRHVLVLSPHPSRQPTARRLGFALGHRITARAPWISRVRREVSPRLLMPSSVCLPPLEFCRGTNPSQAASGRPFSNGRQAARRYQQACRARRQDFILRLCSRGKTGAP